MPGSGSGGARARGASRIKLVMTLLEPQALAALQDPAVSARTVGLRHVSDETPGIKRERSGKSFR